MQILILIFLFFFFFYDRSHENRGKKTKKKKKKEAVTKLQELKLKSDQLFNSLTIFFYTRLCSLYYQINYAKRKHISLKITKLYKLFKD